MKRRLLRGLAAASLVVTITVGGTAKPVQAVNPAIWVDLAINVATLVFGGGGSSDAALRAAVQEIKVQIEQAKNDIIAHTDAVAAADVQACARAATIEVTNIDAMPLPVLILWAQSATNCATLATAYANTLVSPPAVDNIGHVIGPLFAIVFAARAKAGLTQGTDLILQDEIRAYQAVVNKLAPACRDYSDPSGAPIVAFWRYYECVAYNGDRALGKELQVGGTIREPRINRPAVEAEAVRNTSRPIALDALPKLREALP